VYRENEYIINKKQTNTQRLVTATSCHLKYLYLYKTIKFLRIKYDIKYRKILQNNTNITKFLYRITLIQPGHEWTLQLR